MKNEQSTSTQYCTNCNIDIDERVYNYSNQVFRVTLCRTCQEWFRDILNFTSATNESIELYFALRLRGVPAVLEKNDGFKTIDIAVPDAKVNIEVDGGHHNFNADQALRDLERTLFSFKKGFLTIRIPNALVRYNLNLAADKITEFLIISRDRKFYHK
jgi:very-short-patch-repair endonuclease